MSTPSRTPVAHDSPGHRSGDAPTRASGAAPGHAGGRQSDASLTGASDERAASVTDTEDASLIALGRTVIEIEAAAIAALAPRLDGRFAAACRLLLDCSGRIVVCGIGKSGHIGAKLAATFASTGTPAFFLHAAEAAHGDLGMLRSEDVVIALSYSGGSDELLVLLPGIRRLGLALISLCGEPDSALARASDIVLDTRVEREACPLGLAPTSSTSATLALGDALAIALLGARGFGAEDFARAHPGGRLGRRLLLHVSDVMVTGERVPRAAGYVPLAEALVEIGRHALGMTCVVGDGGTLVGVFTDGDLRRALERGEDVRRAVLEHLMTPNPRTIGPDALALAALETMQTHRITALPVVAGGELQGVVTMHALLAAGVA